MKSALAAIGALTMTLTAGLSAQDRMPPIPTDKLTSAQQEAIAAFREARGTGISGPFVPLLRSPEVMTRARAIGDYLRFKSTLAPRLSEFVILITARQWTQQYEWYAHHALALKAGLKAEIADAIAQGRRPAGMAADEEALYDFCDELHRTRGVSDATYAKMVATFGEQGVIDSAGIIGYYTLLAMVMNTARTPLPEGAAAPLPSFPR
jgi:4-carboxymuconolactone decarboxylase